MTFISLCSAGRTQTPGKAMEIFIEFERKPLFFSDPLSVICCYDPAACIGSFAKIECALKAAYYDGSL
jgi:hypothetical protein